MWPTLPSCLPVAGPATAFVILYCRPKSVALLLAVLFALLPRDKRSRSERAIDVLRALQRYTACPMNRGGGGGNGSRPGRSPDQAGRQAAAVRPGWHHSAKP